MTNPPYPAPASSGLRLAGCVIPDDRGRILLLHRNTETRRHWELPGGRVEPGEATGATAAREVREELDVDVLIQQELGAGTFVEDGAELTYTWFLARIVEGTPQVQEPHLHDAFDYFHLDQLREMRDGLSSNMRNLVDELTAGRIRLYGFTAGRNSL